MQLSDRFFDDDESIRYQILIPAGDDTQDERTRVRRAIGDAAHAMSDEQIDEIIAAIQGESGTAAGASADHEDELRTDARITDDDLDALHDLDTAPPAWDLPTEDDGEAYDESADADLHFDSVRADDLGYNPNRDSGGKFAPGAHHDRPHVGAQRQWRIAFDARAYQKAIEGHRQAETVHRAKSLQVGKRMAEIRAKAENATPRERGALRRRYEALSKARDAHHQAATVAREARAQAGKDLEAARSAHAVERRTAVAQRAEAGWDRKRAEAESFMAIGQQRIVGSDGHAPAGATAHQEISRARVTEVEAHAAAQHAGAENQRQSEALRKRQEHEALVAKLEAQQHPTAGARGPGDRQVVHYEKPRQTQEQANAEEHARRQRQKESDARMRARNEAMRPAESVLEPLPVAQTHSSDAVSSARQFLRSLLGG